MQETTQPQARVRWVKPVLTQQPLENTRASLGQVHDALSDRES